MKNQEIKGSLTLESLILQLAGGILKQEDKHLYKLFPHLLKWWHLFLTVFKCLILQSHYIIKLFQIYIIILVIIKRINSSNLLYKDRFYSRNYEQHSVTEQGTVDTTMFQKILRQIFNKINRCIVQNPGTVLAQSFGNRFFC